MKLKRWQWWLLPLTCIIASSFVLTSCSKSPTEGAEPGKSWLIKKKSNKNDWNSFWKDCLPSFNGLYTAQTITSSNKPIDYLYAYLETYVSSGAFASWIFCEISLNISEKCNGNKSYGIDCKNYGLTYNTSSHTATFDNNNNNQLVLKIGGKTINLIGQSTPISIDIKYNKKWQLSYTKPASDYTDYIDLFALENTGNFPS